jgi:hypothetical protein
MAIVSNRDGDGPTGVEFIHEDDGRVTARYAETGVGSVTHRVKSTTGSEKGAGSMYRAPALTALGVR